MANAHRHGMLAMLALALGGACNVGAKLGSSTPATAAAPGCGAELRANDDARMPCIVNGDGTTDKIGQVLAFNCPSFKPASVNIDGADPFPLVAPICYAAVYVGKINAETGGPVKIEIVASRSEYPGGEPRNGITTQTWTNPNGSPGYRFVD
jgi:hypothetical protein